MICDCAALGSPRIVFRGSGQFRIADFFHDAPGVKLGNTAVLLIRAYSCQFAGPASKKDVFPTNGTNCHESMTSGTQSSLINTDGSSPAKTLISEN
jgi:hypothetical protein